MEACGSDSAPGMPAVRVKSATGYGTLIACSIQLVVWACDPLVCTQPHTTIEGSSIYDTTHYLGACARTARPSFCYPVTIWHSHSMFHSTSCVGM